MRTGHVSLEEFTTQINEVHRRKVDLVRETGSQILMADDELLQVDGHLYEINKIVHEQVSDKTGIPQKYYDKMTAIPGLRSQNVNAWFQRNPKVQLVRTLDDKVRAFLSDRYKIMDNLAIVAGMLQVVKGMQLEIKSTNLTYEHMFLQILFPQIKQEVIKGDEVCFGITISNSEVGRGALDIASTVWRLVCANGAIGSSILNEYHLGKRLGEVEDYNFFSDETIQKEIDAFQAKLQNILQAVITEGYFNTMISMMRQSTQDYIDNGQKVIDNISVVNQYSKVEHDKIMQNFITEGAPTRYSLMNSITALAKELDADRAYEIEKSGFEVVSMPIKKWKEITTADYKYEDKKDLK